jgi:hypothetical protein
MRLSRFCIGRVLWSVALGVLLIASQRSRADADVADQAEQSQNPIADLISVPFQNNTNLNVGPERETLNVLNVEPVVPVSLGSDWAVITRTILPVISEPPLSPDGSRTNGIGIYSLAHSWRPVIQVGGFGARDPPYKPRPIVTPSSGTTTGAWGRHSWYCILRRGARGFTASSSTMSGRSEVVASRVITRTDSCNRSSTTTWAMGPIWSRLRSSR